MFAPPVARPKAKTAAPSNNKSALQRATVFGHRNDGVEQAHLLRPLPQGGPGFKNESPGGAWDFSKIPLFPPGREAQFQMPSLAPAPRLPIQAKLNIGAVNDPLEQEADSVAEQVMRMPAPEVALTSAPPKVSRKCAACDEEEKLHKKPAGTAEAAAGEAPGSVHEVLRSPGQPLDASSRAYFEPRFGHDFSRVRVHTDSKAAESARAVSALAYTVGRDLVFGQGQYVPCTSDGHRLIAHELTHVLQQTSGSTMAPDTAPAENEAARIADHISQLDQTAIGVKGQPGQLQRKPQKPSSVKDKTAQDIIDKAQDATKTPDIAKRAKNAVKDILKEYYSDQESKISDVVYDENEPGLETTAVGSGDKTTGKIKVGKSFVDNIGSFARRVLQVGHELQHVDQQRGGKLSGLKQQDEREFLAFDWEASQQPKAGTGSLADAMRRDLIDCALGYLNCLSPDKLKTYDSKKTALLKLRETVNGTKGNPKTDPPDACKQCNPEKKKSSTPGKSSALEQGVDIGEGEEAGETRVVMNDETLAEEDQATV